VKDGTILCREKEYEAISNSHGAISGICENGEPLGVKPQEFVFVEAPEWVLKIWAKYDDSGAAALLKKLWQGEGENV